MMPRMVVSALLAAAAFGGEVPARQEAIGKQIASMEKAVDKYFRSISVVPAIPMIGTARGVYLAGYGAVFSVEINLVPVANVSPFRSAYSEEEKRQLNARKRQRLEDLERMMREILTREGAALTEVGAEEQVALAVSLFYFPWEDLTQLPRQVVMAGARGELASAADLRTRYY